MKPMFLRSLYLLLLTLAGLPQQSPSVPSDHGGIFQIAGTIVDASTGAPIGHTRALIGSVSQPDTTFTMITGDNGQFVFSDLAAGKYSLRAQRRGYVTQFFDQHGLLASSIAVGPDVDSSHLVFPLSPESSIVGAITDEAGEPVPDAQVLLYETSVIEGVQGTRLHGTTSTDDEGYYEFAHLSSGRFMMAVSARVWYAERLRPGPLVQAGSGARSVQNSTVAASGQVPSALDVAFPITFYPNATEPERAAPIDLKSGDQFEANMGLQPLPAMHFHLNPSGSNSRIASVQLEARSFAGSEIAVPGGARPTPSGGVDVVAVTPGNYTMQISSVGGNSMTQSSREIDVLASGRVEMPPEGSQTELAVMLRVDSGVALPDEGALLFHSTTGKGDFLRAFSGIHKLEFTQGLPRATYEISLLNAPSLHIKAMSAVGATLRGQTVEIKGAPAKLEIGLGHVSGKISGVALRDGRPAAGATIVLVPADAPHNQPGFRSDQSDSDGTFTLLDVLPGDYTLVAIDKGYDLEWQKPSVVAPYLPHGRILHVADTGLKDVKIDVSPKIGNDAN
jgi:hypothetical protein